MMGSAALGLSGRAFGADDPQWTALAQDLRSETQWAWRHYVDRAFGHDQIKPLSGTHEPFYTRDQSVGLTIVEALDTLWLMELDEELEHGLDWIYSHLSFDIDAPFQVFEVSIRMLGGLLAGYHCVGDDRLLRLAADLGDRLLPAFTRSPTGIPYRFVSFATGAVGGVETNLAEAGTYITEFGTLSKLTGDDRYRAAARRALEVTYSRRSALGLLPFAVHAETANWLNTTATVGPPADSYYEYLFDGWKLLGDTELRDWYDSCMRAILEHQSQRVDGRLWFAQVDVYTGEPVGSRQNELASFFSGLLAEGGYLDQAKTYHRSWNDMQDHYGVLPEDIDYRTLEVLSPGNQLRPEFVDGAFSLWLATRDDRYRRQAAKHYGLMKSTARAPYGYAILTDVLSGQQGDSCPSYWWCEQLKYYWLMFSNCPRFDYDDHYLSTEGHMLRGARR